MMSSGSAPQLQLGPRHGLVGHEARASSSSFFLECYWIYLSTRVRVSSILRVGMIFLHRTFVMTSAKVAEILAGVFLIHLWHESLKDAFPVFFQEDL